MTLCSPQILMPELGVVKTLRSARMIDCWCLSRWLVNGRSFENLFIFLQIIYLRFICSALVVSMRLILSSISATQKSIWKLTFFIALPISVISIATIWAICIREAIACYFKPSLIPSSSSVRIADQLFKSLFIVIDGRTFPRRSTVAYPYILLWVRHWRLQVRSLHFLVVNTRLLLGGHLHKIALLWHFSNLCCWYF